MGPFKYLLGDYGDVKWKEKKKKKPSAISQALFVFNGVCGAGIMVSLKITASFPYKYLY